MSAGPFRPSVVDRLELVERLEERVRVATPLAWVLTVVQGALVAAAGAWALFGHLPVNAHGEAVCVAVHGGHVVVDLDAPGTAAVPLGARAVLEARDDSHRRYTGTVAAVGVETESSGRGRPAAAAAWRGGAGPRAVEIALDAGGARPLEQGERYSVVLTLREEAPAAHLVREWWH